MVFDGGDHSGSRGRGAGPFPMHDGMYRLLTDVEVTFRPDGETL
jgi:translation initiation factor RLI1